MAARLSVFVQPSPPGHFRTDPSRQSKNHSRSLVGRAPSALAGSRYMPSVRSTKCARGALPAIVVAVGLLRPLLRPCANERRQFLLAVMFLLRHFRTSLRSVGVVARSLLERRLPPSRLPLRRTAVALAEAGRRLIGVALASLVLLGSLASLALGSFAPLTPRILSTTLSIPGGAKRRLLRRSR